MGLYDRDYMRSDNDRERGLETGPGNRGPNKNVIITVIVIIVLLAILTAVLS